MSNLPDDGRADFETVGLSTLFIQMPESFRPEIVRCVLTGRERTSGDARAELDRSIKAAVNVDGFRNAAKAPPPLLQGPVANAVQYRDDLAGAVLRVWAELRQPLRDMVRAHLTERSLLDDEPTYSINSISMGRLGPRWDEAIDQLIELHPDLDRDDLLLMSYYSSGRIPGDEEDSDSPRPVSDDLPGIFRPTLDILRKLPAGSPEWGQTLDSLEAAARDLVEEIGAIREEARLAQVRELTELDSQLRAMSERHAGLLEFFEWDVKEELARRTDPWADVPAARQVVDRLASLLDEYAPVHPIAAVRSEEAQRAPRRFELQEQVDAVLAQFDALEVRRSATTSRLVEPRLPGTPEVGPSVPEGQRAVSDAELSTLRAENDRLTAENRSLHSTNRQLTEQASELESDLNESRNLAETWRRDNQDLRRSQQPTADAPLPDFQSVAEVVRLAEGSLADRLSFILNSKSDVEVPFDNPRQVWDALEWLATTYHQAKTGENGEPDFNLSLRQVCGWRYVPDQSETTMGRYRDYYETWADRRKLTLREHIGTGNGYHRGTIRIAFAWEAEKKRVIVGYIGRHQRTRAS